MNVSKGARPSLADLTVVIPARNEADVIHHTLQGLANQSPHLKVVLVDDGSDDGTAEIASKSPLTNLRIVKGKPLPAGWSGKLWAQNQGLGRVETPIVLLLDADIYLDDGMLGSLLKKMQNDRLDFISLMAKPSLRGFWERALMPAFVYFFKLLYPFAASNSNNRHFAAAAGGCILMNTEIIQAIGGLQSIRDAVIDDCTLAKKVKSKGYRTWTGLTQNVHSLRPYQSLSDIWNMVARTAYTQLHYSWVLLGFCIFIMADMFLLPFSSPFLGNPNLMATASLSFLFMATSYLPTLRFYGRNPAWVFGLPAVALLYLGMTWTSAWRYWNGEKSRWKNRVYEKETCSEEV